MEEQTTGEILKNLRVLRGLTQLEIARQTGISQGTLSDFERDKRLPTTLQLVLLADCLKCTTDELLCRSSSKNPTTMGEVSHNP